MKTEYVFEIFKYRNGHGKEFYRIKQQKLFGIWWWWQDRWEDIRNFEDREEVMTVLEAFINNIRKDRERVAYWKTADKLTLIVKEKITLKV